MKRILGYRPSPAMIVALLALVTAAAGTAIAAPLAVQSALNKQEKKQVKRLAQGEINKAAPGLSVANAANASTVDGANASDLKTSSAFDQNTSTIASLGSSPVTVASTTITTHGTGRILATASAELFGDDSSEVGGCFIVIDTESSTTYEADPDDIGTHNQVVIAVNYAVTRPAGTYLAQLKCLAQSGTVGKDSAAISVYGLGA